MTSEESGDKDPAQGLSFSSSAIANLEARLHELTEEDRRDRPRWGQINDRLAQLKEEHDARMLEKNALLAEQGSIRGKAHKRSEEYRNIQQAVVALKGARDSDAARPNGSHTTSTPPHGLPTVTKASETAMTATPSRVRPMKEVETIIIESDEEEEGDDGLTSISASAADRQLFKPVDAIHGRFPTVVNINGQWYEIQCKGCGANIKPGTSSWFKGLRGLQVHYSRCHRPRGSFTPFAPATAETCCIMRSVSTLDVGLMEQGLPPRDVAIEAVYAPKMLSESRREITQPSSNVGSSDREVPRTPTKMSGVHDHRGRDGSQR
ncbi:hypothetical protein HII31_00180 [Pseudocercospora fuligena]|uniref:Uncharacterized protein n=1 Tax=Pseudocercospora fuligena TaxID=685502 RepID=A0A8H6RYC0_9PEZI|nr:hypothetical protein HII31_00180 [Pseudocercospora fuligena]